jgi:predicted DNA binding protein
MTVQRHVPATDSVTRVEFTVSNTSYPFVAASATEGCRTVLQEILPRGDGTYAEFFAVTGMDPSDVQRLAADSETVDPTLLETFDDGGLFEYEVTGDCPAVTLSELGALPRTVYSVDGVGTVSGEIPASADAAAVVDAFLQAHPSADLVVKERQPYVTPMFGHRKYKQVIADRLTARQEEVLAAANESGYYEWPREITAEDLAADLDITASTLLKHLRAVERAFVTAFFEEPTLPDGASGDSSGSDGAA